MNKWSRASAAVAVLLFGWPPPAPADTDTIECVKSAEFFAAPTGEPRHYAPDRDVAIEHLALDVTPDFQRRTVAGTATFRFKPNVKPVQEIKLDAVDLDVQAVTSTERILGYQATEEQLIVTLAEPIPAGKETSLSITYRAEPKRGLYFRTPEMGYKEGDTHLFSQGEEIEARHWYPCFDSPNEKFTSEVTCHVPEGMTVVSNGRLVSEDKDPQSGLKAVHWSQEKPHANYLISLVAGYFKKIEDKHKDVPLAFYTPASEIGEAANSFRDSKAIMAFFDEEIGVPYPWPKYDQVCVNDFVAGGMENTSATTLTDGTLFTAASENVRTSEGLVAHEMAHQWFGDLVTCKDWSHIWLNEGFATYYDMLYEGHAHGRDSLLYSLYVKRRQITAMTDDVNPIVRRNYGEPREMFGYLAYPKGSWVLHMLRSQLGEALYRRCIKTYLERHQYGSVVSEDLRAVIEELSGRSYDQFFDQWLYHAHNPELEVAYTWDERMKAAKISVRQVQQISATVLLFDFPLTVRCKGKSGVAERIFHVKEKEEEFFLPLDSAPQIVWVDPDCALFARISFTVPSAMLYAQLAEPKEVVGRLVAVDQLGKKQGLEAVARLKEALNQDPFWGVRSEASRALRSIHNDEALAALLASLEQPDARVRHQVVEDLAGFYRDTAYAIALKTIGTEKNPDIQAAAIRSLGAYSKPESQAALLKALNSDSFRNELASAAIAAMRAQDDPVYLQPLMETLTQRKAAFTTRGFAQSLESLAYLARNEEKKDGPRDFLLNHLNEKRRVVLLASINALGTLGDPRAIAALETFASTQRESPERSAAERAITTLRAGRKPVDDFRNLRQEVLDLQKTNREMRRELDDLKKKVENRTPPPPEPATSPQKPATKPKKR